MKNFTVTRKGRGVRFKLQESMQYSLPRGIVIKIGSSCLKMQLSRTVTKRVTYTAGAQTSSDSLRVVFRDPMILPGFAHLRLWNLHTARWLWTSLQRNVHILKVPMGKKSAHFKCTQRFSHVCEPSVSAATLCGFGWAAKSQDAPKKKAMADYLWAPST